MTASRLSMAMTLMLLVLRPTQAYSFTAPSGMLSARGESVRSTPRMSRTLAPPKRRTKARPATQRPKKRNPLEYLKDLTAPRGDNDPFHIIMFQETFDQPRITMPYIVGQLMYTLDMPDDDAYEHAKFAKQQVRGAGLLINCRFQVCMSRLTTSFQSAPPFLPSFLVARLSG